VVGHVLADALLAAAAHVDHGGQAGEVRRHVGLEPLQRVAVDLHRQLSESLEKGHELQRLQAARRLALTRHLPLESRAMSTSSEAVGPGVPLAPQSDAAAEPGLKTGAISFVSNVVIGV